VLLLVLTPPLSLKAVGSTFYKRGDWTPKPGPPPGPPPPPPPPPPKPHPLFKAALNKYDHEWNRRPWSEEMLPSVAHGDAVALVKAMLAKYKD